MYVACIKRPNKRNYYVMRGVWDNGKVRHEVIACLGSTPDVNKAYERARADLKKAQERAERIRAAMEFMRIQGEAQQRV